MALQELLVGTSFLVIQTIVNTFGVTASAGVGVAEKVRVFAAGASAHMHSMSAFVAQNMGPASPGPGLKRALGYGILTAAAGLVMAWLAFFHGDTLSLVVCQGRGGGQRPTAISRPTPSTAC